MPMPVPSNKRFLIFGMLVALSAVFVSAQTPPAPTTTPPTTPPTGTDASDPMVNLSQSTQTISKELPDIAKNLNNANATNAVPNNLLNSNNDQKKDDANKDEKKDEDSNSDDQNLEDQLNGNGKDALYGKVLDDPVVKQQLYNYLDAQEVPQSELDAYHKAFIQTQQMLKAGNLVAALNLLYVLGDYDDIDAGISTELAHRVEATFGMQNQNFQLTEANNNLKKQLDDASWNVDTQANNSDSNQITSDKKKTTTTTESDSAGGTGASLTKDTGNNSNNRTYSLIDANSDKSSSDAGLPANPYSALGKNTMQISNDIYTALEDRAKMKINDMKASRNLEQAKADFGAYISSLVASQRYTHAILAASFYRAFFQTDEYPVAIATQVNLALEGNQKTEQACDALKYNIDRGYVAAATTNLQIVFTLNPNYPELLGLPRPKKAVIRQFLDSVVLLKNALKARDFNRVKTVTDEMTTLAHDFDPTEPLALVNAIKLKSMMDLGKARLYVQKGDTDAAMKAFQDAGKLWPSNPDLQTGASTFFTQEDTKTQATTEFDRLVNDKNWRGIFDKQTYFATAIAGDTDRENQMKSALETVKTAEETYEKAHMMMLHSDADGAWETMRTALDNNLDDPKVNNYFVEVSSQAADFVNAINQAKKAEVEHNYGFSLAWYVKAQQMYPPSEMANAGIQRLTKTVLNNSSDLSGASRIN